MAGRTCNALWLFWFLFALVQATCYNTYGDIQAGDVPCNPDNDVSTCCSANDYCLSNGLCLDASANNVMTQQSCTDPNWGAPCHKFCTESNGYGEIAVLPCDQSWDGGGALSYCCDPDAAACCSSSSWFDVPVGTVVRKPVVSSTAQTSSPITSATDHASNTHSDKSPSSETTSPPPKNSNSNSNANSNSDTMKIGLGVGLGVGIPVLLALAGAVAFLAIKLRRSKQTAAVQYIPQQEFPKNEAPANQYHYEMPAGHVN